MAKINAMVITLGVVFALGSVADHFGSEVGRSEHLALIDDWAGGDEARGDLLGRGDGEVELGELVMVPARLGAEVADGGGEVGAGYVDGEIASLFDELIGKSAWPNQDGPSRSAPSNAKGAPANGHGVGGLIF